jgi:hypothetical protein
MNAGIRAIMRGMNDSAGPRILDYFVGGRLTGQVASSAVRTAWPATRPAHPFLEFGAHTLNVLPSGFRFLDRYNPANPLIAREWRNVFPFCPRRRIRKESFS